MARVKTYLVTWSNDEGWNTECLQALSPQQAVDFVTDFIPAGAKITEVAEVKHNWRQRKE